MDIIILILVYILGIVFPLCIWYKPKIEIVKLVRHYNVYLEYNRYNGVEYRGRTHIYLFTV